MSATVLPLEYKIWEDSVFFILIEAIKYTEKGRGQGLFIIVKYTQHRIYQLNRF